MPWQAAAPGWVTCGGLPDSYNNTACPATATCARQNWMPSEGRWGCCPYPSGVSCSNYTCCPEGTTCQNADTGYRVTSSCVDSQGRVSPPGSNGGGLAVCKSGGPLPFSTVKPNVIILGDSVSIGYEPFVSRLMADDALVQHSPWGVRVPLLEQRTQRSRASFPTPRALGVAQGDGGAEETQYGWECLECASSPQTQRAIMREARPASGEKHAPPTP